MAAAISPSPMTVMMMALRIRSFKRNPPQTGGYGPAVACNHTPPVFEWNPSSMRVLEKLGFERVAHLRKSVTKDGQLIGSVLYAYLLNP
jgi:hypothetical protein